MSDSRAQVASTVALIAVITLVTGLLVVFTDMNVLLRGLIAIVAGVIAAAITSSLVRRRSKSS